jgi:flagellar capping protein FliD
VVNQGISVRLSGLLERALDTSSSTQGLFKTASTAITNQRNTLQRQIELMERQLTARQAALEKSFIDMEKAQSRSQSMLSQLTKAFQSSSSS